MAKIFETVMLLFVIFTVIVMAEDYDVGDDFEWRRPNDIEFYNKWVVGKTFRVGDILEFDFARGMHDVAMVTKEGYDNCSKENPLNLFQTPPVKVTLNTTGPHYFICTVGDHCLAGQKLSVTVAGTTGSPGRGGAAPAPRSGPTTPSVPPTTNSSGTVNGEAPPSNSVASLVGAGFFAAAMSVVVALLN